MSNFLSIYFGYHDSCVTFGTDKVILLHLEAERVFRKKHIRVTVQQMEELVQVGLHYLGLEIHDFDILYLARWNNQFDECTASVLGKIFHPVITSHHENHIGTSYPSGFDSALIVCADGGSEDGCTKFYLRENNNIRVVADFSDEIITGRFYGTLTQVIIDPDFSKAHKSYPGKTMGLAALGEFSNEFYDLLNKYRSELNKLHIEGVDKLRDIFGLSDDYSKPWVDKRRCDLAFTAQKYWADTFLDKIREYSDLSGNICMVGGCALNVLLNTSIIESNLFKSMYVSPVSGDNGQSLGAILFHNPNINCEYPFLGRGYGDLDKVPDDLMKDLLNHKVIAWYQGRSEIGARALGHRSLIGLPDSLEMKIRLSQMIKKREVYRPVAPMVPPEYLSDFFNSECPSPFMTYAPKVKDITQQRSPAIVHDDGTSRVQTVDISQNKVLHTVLCELGEVTGVPILMNSSFNNFNEPIVDTPDDAISSFLASGADVLYVNGKRYERS